MSLYFLNYQSAMSSKTGFGFYSEEWLRTPAALARALQVKDPDVSVQAARKQLVAAALAQEVDPGDAVLEPVDRAQAPEKDAGGNGAAGQAPPKKCRREPVGRC